MKKIKDTKWYKHLATINHHKLEVGKNCFRCGLYRQGLLHDLSKYSWAEFSVGAKYFQGNRSPNEAEREATGVTTSWLHHKGRNKHHLEYWIDYSPNREIKTMIGMKMPDNYIVEMFCDRVAASKKTKIIPISASTGSSVSQRAFLRRKAFMGRTPLHDRIKKPSRGYRRAGSGL